MDELFSALEAVVTKHNGSLLKTEKWGKRNLKYAIKKHTKGNFCFLFFTGTAETLKDIDRTVRYNEQVIRYTVLKLEKNFSTAVSEGELAAAEVPIPAEAPVEAAEPAATTAEA
jgi:small subunit ribosomal protein S6